MSLVNIIDLEEMEDSKALDLLKLLADRTEKISNAKDPEDMSEDELKEATLDEIDDIRRLFELMASDDDDYDTESVFKALKKLVAGELPVTDGDISERFFKYALDKTLEMTFDNPTWVGLMTSISQNMDAIESVDKEDIEFEDFVPDNDLDKFTDYMKSVLDKISEHIIGQPYDEIEVMKLGLKHGFNNEWNEHEETIELKGNDVAVISNCIRNIFVALQNKRNDLADEDVIEELTRDEFSDRFDALRSVAEELSVYAGLGIALEHEFEKAKSEYFPAFCREVLLEQ